ncbi:coenzyme F420-0:L-glutamate ligase [Erysipelothrix urinaevulpis]|uniref:coenzyme F420-0:L-glutamate ligase n=1 Tax=Erysipelothrix urinaevulpis TaxID=2683717 RepID=UPI001358C2DD|nr:coenzyme F420-0:L-glutamate ligase [Erysipelothrix urinaevulpis]
MTLKANKDKNLDITINGNQYLRIPINTHTIMPKEELLPVIKKYASDHLEDGDILFVTEKIVAISQGRALPLDDIEPRKLATFLSNYVSKTPHGIGLGMPETMEMALQECGTPRILFASAISALGKIVGRKGDFYRVAGSKARAIDGPTSGTIPPFNQYVVLGPENPDQVANEIKALFDKKIEVIIVDINDLGGNILGSSSKALDLDLYVDILKDNPLGQAHQSTPLGIIRKG